MPNQLLAIIAILSGLTRLAFLHTDDYIVDQAKV